MKSLKPRLLTAIIGIVVLLGIIILSELWRPLVTILLALTTMLVIGEYLYGHKLLKTYLVSIPCMIFGSLSCLLIGLNPLKDTKFVYLLFFVFIITEFIVIIVNHEKGREKIVYSDLTYALIGTLIITFGTASIAYLCKTGLSLSFYFVVIFALPWMADTGGFFVGSAFGKHKLCPKISPKKTVEGAAGGVIFCVLAAILIGFIFQFLITPDYTVRFIPLIIIGAFGAVLSIVGDLSFSLIKRSLNIKDYGNIIPGHGGLLDRLDSVLFTVPVVLIINTFLPIMVKG